MMEYTDRKKNKQELYRPIRSHLKSNVHHTLPKKVNCKRRVMIPTLGRLKACKKLCHISLMDIHI